MTLSAIARQAATIFGLPAVLVAAWWIYTTQNPSFFFPPLPDILAEFGDTWVDGRIQRDAVPSLARLTAGYGIALGAGVALGVAVGQSPRLRQYSEPGLEFLRAIPPPVMIPIIMLFAGIGDGMKVAVIAVGCMWPILLNTVEGVRAVDETLRDTARCYQLKPRTQLVHLLLRGASPQIATGARQALSVGIILMVVSEMFAGSNGLGFAIVQFQRSFAMPEMWSGVIVLGLIGVVLALLFRMVEVRVLDWYYGIREMERKA